MTNSIGAPAAQAEVWMPIDGYVGLYEVSNLGRVRSLQPPRGDGIMRGDVDRYGYRRVLLARDGGKVRFKVHRLVCQAFHGEAPDGHEVGHLDGDKSNNCAANLAWVTRSENSLHKAVHGVRYVGHSKGGLPGSKNPHAKLSADQVRELRSKAANGQSGRALAREYGITSGNASRIIRGASYASEI